MKDGDGEEDDRTQRLVAELAEVRRRMSLRAIPAAPKSRADASGAHARLSTPPPSPSTTPTNGGSSPPRPALGTRIPTQRIVTEGTPLAPVEEEMPVSRRPTKG